MKEKRNKWEEMRLLIWLLGRCVRYDGHYKQQHLLNVSMRSGRLSADTTEKLAASVFRIGDGELRFY